MKTSEQIDLISTALAIAQGKFTSVTKDKVNPHFKSKHATLDKIIEMAIPILSSEGIALIQAPSFVENRVIITTRLIHKSGQWLESEFSIKPSKDDAQALGSATTYGRRYALGAMIGVAETLDDDGNEATNPKKEDSAIQNLNKVYTGNSEDKRFLFAIMEKHGVTDTHLMTNINSRCVGKTIGSLEKIVIEMVG